MGFLRKLVGDKQPGQCSFDGRVIPVTESVDEFIRIVRVEKEPIGLLVRIKDWMLVYGQLLHSTSGIHGSHLFEIREGGPCRVICARCNAKMDAATLATLGPDSVMAAFGVAPVKQCRACGNPNVVIVSARGRRKGTRQ
jgi:hypothetical protein